MKLRLRAWYVLAEEMIDEILMISFIRKEIIGKFSNGYISVPLKFEDKRNGEDVILMQSTGLFDRNSKEIFEGDIITNGKDVICMERHNTLGFYVEQKGKIEFIADCAVLEEFEEDAKEIADSLEIIGNIYENPELLEVNHDTIR
ncbi:YopX family protein [Streptococcus vulneris]|uniref:YopX family protein n=1 Tax=Streptococcus vulneris TaxID=2853160 RepID=A0ABS6SW00_9STRE|nr:YopX family protein [Streptococcus vulneris]MBV7365931.1 YopX family protein [Streptococcus vulneris]